MISTLKGIMEIRGMSGANRLMFYFRKIPVVGKLVPASVYSETTLKQTLAVIVYILKVIWGFLSKFAYLGLMIYLPVRLAAKELPQPEQYNLYLQLLICISFLVAAVSNAVILEPKRDKYIFVKLMRLPAERYMRATLALRGVSFMITFVPAMMVFGSLLGAPPWQGAVLAVLLSFWRTACEALHLRIFDRYGVIVVKKTSWVWTVIGAGYLLAYMPLSPGLTVTVVDSQTLFSLPLVLGVIALGAACAVYIARYAGYRNAVDAVTKIDDPLLDMGRMMKEARVKEVATREPQYTEKPLDHKQFSAKSGYAYLNAIFFSRHRRFLIEPVRRRLAVIGALFAAGLVILLLSADGYARISHYLIRSLPAFLIIMNYTSIGERVCKAMFYNCDLSLLRYGFYREQSAILSNFRIRLLRISLLNLIPAAAICLAVNLLILLSDERWGAADVIVFCLTILALSLFFSVHHLFMYYIFQPYSTELNVKNPFFTIVNSIVLAVGIIGIQFKSTPENFALTVLLSAAAYMVLALIIVYRFSARTFRVK